MDLTELQSLITLLRATGVTKYVGLNSLGEPVTLELGPLPAVAAPVDLNREGFGATPTDGRSPELKRMLSRLDPAYSDPTLFAIT